MCSEQLTRVVELVSEWSKELVKCQQLLSAITSYQNQQRSAIVQQIQQNSSLTTTVTAGSSLLPL